METRLLFGERATIYQGECDYNGAFVLGTDNGLIKLWKEVMSQMLEGTSIRAFIII